MISISSNNSLYLLRMSCFISAIFFVMFSSSSDISA